MNKLATSRLAVGLAVVVLSACGGRGKIESDLGIKGAPDWVNGGASAVSDQKGRFIQGVGMSSPIGDLSLQRSTADNRACAKVAGVMSTYVDATIEDYTSSANGEVDANVTREINSVTKLALNGAKIAGRWKDKKTGDIYAFCELDMKNLDRMMETSQQLGASFKQYYKDSSQDTFNRFVEETQQ